MIDRSDDIIVDRVTVPTPADERTRYSFRRARGPAQEMVRSAWSESAGTCVYLGEWHTHPEQIPEPSPADVQDWSRLFRETKRRPSSLIFLIVGIQCTRAWELEDGTLRVLKDCEVASGLLCADGVATH